MEITGSNPVGDAFWLSPVESACGAKTVVAPRRTATPYDSGTVRQLAERRTSNLRVCGFDSRLCHFLISIHPSAGHRRAQVAVTHSPLGCAGSTPARRTFDRAVRLSVQDTSLSSWRGGFNSRTGQFAAGEQSRRAREQEKEELIDQALCSVRLALLRSPAQLTTAQEFAHDQVV